MKHSLERMFYLDQLDAIYCAARDACRAGGDFPASTLRHMGVEFAVSPEDMARIPSQGPVVVVANHPFGGIEGVGILKILRAVRPDVKIFANYLLGRMPEMAEHSIYVDPFEGREAQHFNIRPIKESLRWLDAGHVLVVFPAGEVSHIDIKKWLVTDPPWTPNIARIIRRAKTPVVPIFFEGHNGPLFQCMGLLHPRIRTALLPHELVNKRNRVLQVQVGNPIPFKRLEKIVTDRALIEFLRFRCYLLANRRQRRKSAAALRRKRQPEEMAPVADPEPAEWIAAEIDRLTPDHRLLENEGCTVYLARADEIPHALREIGRLREQTFRGEGEGTGQPIDLDRFDQHYLHMFLWDKIQRRLAGAYRIAKSEEVLAKHGKRGLYTSTLFRYSRKLLRQLGPALELGRSFVRPEYQRNYTSLLMLWKGIGCVISRDPRYQSMFGPVSINNQYQTVSRELMVAFLSLSDREKELSRLIKARHPFRARRFRDLDPVLLSQTVTDASEIDELVGEFEKEQKGLPILLKQYLKLGGKLLGFNVDPDFSNVLDGLIWVNLHDTDPRIIERFMGKENADKFFAFRRAQAAKHEEPKQEAGRG